jgi:hypothetical protein
MIAGVRNKFRSTLLTFLLTSLKPNPQSVCGLGCTLLNPAQILLNHFLTQSSFLKMRSQIGNLLLKLGVLFGSMEKLGVLFGSMGIRLCSERNDQICA